MSVYVKKISHPSNPNFMILFENNHPAYAREYLLVEHQIFEHLRKKSPSLSQEKIVIDSINFKFDCRSEDCLTVYEIYSGLGRPSAGTMKKLRADMFKMALYERVLGKPVEKYLVIVSKKLKNHFLNSALNKAALNYFDIKLKLITSEKFNTLIQKAKERLASANVKKPKSKK